MSQDPEGPRPDPANPKRYEPGYYNQGKWQTCNPSDPTLAKLRRSPGDRDSTPKNQPDPTRRRSAR